MKKIMMAVMVFISLNAEAQLKEGRIVYERIMQMPVRSFNMDPEIAAQIPKSRTDQFELLFGNHKSLWQFLPNAANEGDGNTFAGGGVVVRFNSGNDDINYMDFEKGLRVDQREILQRNYIVTDSIRKMSWKLTDETKTILNYTVRKASAKRISSRTQMSMENGEIKRTSIPDTAEVIAWFTTEIPVPVGPDYGGQLPGAILELDIAGGQTVYRAIEISDKVNKGKIREPKDGKKITAAEFVKEREQVMEEMRRNSPNGNTIRIQN